ncbi:MAG: hypothetical protein PHO41_08800 [Eubacteriales bacterium]|nr:hypothetical protein [Eubacteriales bacterium]
MSTIQSEFPSGGNGTVTVTVSDVLLRSSENVSGITITMTCGDIVRSAVTDTSGIAKIIFPSAGTYTLSADTIVFGLTSSITVVKGGQYTVSAYAGYDDYKTWLLIGEIDPQDYADLASVVADAAAMETLANSAAAVDYMMVSKAVIMPAVVGSVNAMTQIGLASVAMNACILDATWITAILASANAITGLDASAPITIPVMTGYTTPSGVVSASSYYDYRYYPWKAFVAKDPPSGWSSASGDNPGAWVQYQFDTTLYPDGVWIYKIHEYDTQANSAALITVLASENGTDFDVIVAQGSYPMNTDNTRITSASKRYRYIRFRVDQQSCNVNTSHIDYVQVYGK